MNIDDMTREQLLVEAKNRGFQKYYNWNKAKLLQEIAMFDHNAGTLVNPADEINAQEALAAATVEPTAVGDKKLSAQANKWKEYFDKTQITPADFLKRYPNHKYKVFISELI